MAIVLSVLPFTLLGRTDNAIAIRKNGKWKDRQYNNHQKEE
jgi:hypothetical protein